MNPNFTPSARDEEYDKAVFKTSRQIARFVLPLFSENADIFFPEEDLTPEQIQQNNVLIAQIGGKVFEYLLSTDIPADYASYFITNYLSKPFEQMQRFLDGTVIDKKDELMSFTIGVKSPRTGKYAAEYSTLAELVATLEKVKEEKALTDNDFFNGIDEQTAK